jgi:hypothetical protein
MTLVNAGLSSAEIREVRESVNRGRPLGSPGWVKATAQRLGPEFTLRGPGRPPKNFENE